MIVTGVFAKDVGLIAGSTPHVPACTWSRSSIVGVFTFGGSWLLYKMTDAIIPLRVTDEEEELGLDLSQHGESIIVAEQVAL